MYKCIVYTTESVSTLVQTINVFGPTYQFGKDCYCVAYVNYGVLLMVIVNSHCIISYIIHPRQSSC